MEEFMKKILLAVIALSFAGTVSAASYQAQGCGLGSTIWTDGSSLVHQVLGATTNGTSGNNTFGMTSGTSNCELDGAGGQAQVIFIEANKVALSNDIARGEGDTLASLTRMYGCTNLDAVGSVLQENYGKIFAEGTSSVQVDAQITSLIDNSKACI
jgi:hypothetical protein